MAVKLDAERRRLWLDIAQVWTGATLANILLYFFQIVVGRGLGPQDYSLFGALLGMVYLASAASNAINASVADVVARQKANGDADAGSAAGSALLQMMALGGVLFALTCLASPLLGAYVHSDSLTPVMLTNALLLTALIVPVTQGALLGEQRFGWYSAGQILSSSSRLLLGVGALALGLGISGVMGAAIVSVLATFVLGMAIIRPSIRVSWESLRRGPLGRMLLPTAIGFLAVSMPTSADVLIARHFFSPHEAGLYAGVATLGRIILFLPASISLVLFPKIAHDSAKGGSGQGFLRTGLGLTFVLSGSATLLFLLAPRLVLRTALGGEYVGADNLLPLYAIASFLFSLVIFLLYFHLARRQFSYLYLVLLPHIVAEFLLPYAFHSSAEQLAGVLIFVNMSLLVFSLAFTRLSQEGPIPITKRILTPLREFQADRL